MLNLIRLALYNYAFNANPPARRDPGLNACLPAAQGGASGNIMDQGPIADPEALANSFWAVDRADLWGIRHIYRGSGFHWADGLNMPSDLAFMSVSTFESFYDINFSDPQGKWSISNQLGTYTGSGMDGLTNAMIKLNAVKYDQAPEQYGFGSFTYTFAGKTYGGTYHTINGVVTSTATSQVVQTRSGAWVSIGATTLSTFANVEKTQPARVTKLNYIPYTQVRDITEFERWLIRNIDQAELEGLADVVGDDPGSAGDIQLVRGGDGSGQEGYYFSMANSTRTKDSIVIYPNFGSLQTMSEFPIVVPLLDNGNFTGLYGERKYLKTKEDSIKNIWPWSERAKMEWKGY